MPGGFTGIASSTTSQTEGIPPHDFSLRTIARERGVMLHDVGEEIEHVYFPHTGVVSLVAVMQSGATVESATIGRSGVIGASTGLGARLRRPVSCRGESKSGH